jgi:hypothetical protein
MAATDKQPLLAACEGPQLDEKKSKTSRSSSIQYVPLSGTWSDLKLNWAPRCLNLSAYT